MLAPADQRLAPTSPPRLRSFTGRPALWISAALILAVIGVKLTAGPRADQIAPQTAIQMENATLQALPLRLQSLPSQAIPPTLAALDMTEGERQALQQALSTRPLHMAFLAVYDSGAEDGDIIRVETLGLSHIVHLTKQPITVPVFLPANGRIRITAIDQGMGGGVTLGILSNGSPLAFAPMAVGQTLSIPAVLIDQP